MAKKSLKKDEVHIELGKHLGTVPQPPHRLDMAKTRRQMLETYSTMERKQDWHDTDAFMRVESPASSFFGGLDPRRRKEVADGGMVQEDQSAMSNLSPQFVHREYPRAGYYANPYIDDTVKGPSGEDQTY